MKTTNSGKIKVVFLNPFCKPFIGGAEISLEKIMRGLKKTGLVKTHLITSHLNAEGTFLNNRTVTSGDVTKVGLDKSIGISESAKWKKEVSGAHFTELFKHLPACDAVYLNYAFYLNDEAFRKLVATGKTIVIKIIYTKALEEIASHLNTIVTVKNVYIHCISKQIEKEVVKMGIPKRQLLVCPNPVDTNFFYPSKTVLAKNRGLRFIYTGRLAPQKNIPELVELFKHISNCDKEARLTVIGKITHQEMGPVIDALKRTSRQIIWLPEVDNKKIGKYLRKNDFFIMASKDEGMSNSLLEAMSCGLCPVVPKDVSGMRDLITNGLNGIFYDRRNLKFAGKTIAGIPRQKIKLLGKRARGKVVQLCSIDRVVKKHLNFYLTRRS